MSFYPTKTVWGANANVPVLRPKILRNYDPPGVFPTWNIGLENLSFKIDPPLILTGAYDLRLMNFCLSTTTPKYLTYQHEPENPQKKLDPQQFCAAFRHVAGIVHASGAPIRTVLNLMEYTLQPIAHRQWQTWFPGNGFVDVFGWDVYWPNLSEPASLRLADCVAATKLAGVANIAFPEIGVIGGNASKVAEVTAAISAINPEFATYFDNGQWNISADAAASAAWRDNQ